MTIIVQPGSTVTVINGTGFTLTSDSTVAAGGLLDGSGTVVGAFTLLNLGTMAADVPGAVLSINTGTMTNQGTISAIDGTFVVQSLVADTNLIGSTLTGGVWNATGTGVVELMSGQIITDNATITLDGTAAGFDGASAGILKPIDNSLITIGTTGALNLLDGRNFTAATSLVVNGLLTIGGGSVSANSGTITVGAAGDIVGSGTVGSGDSIEDDGTIEATGGTLTPPGASSISGVGELKVDPGASLALQAFGSYAQSVVNNGTIDAMFGGLTGTLGFSGPYSGTGEFLIEGGFDAGDHTVLELPSTISGNVTFDTSFGVLLLDQASAFNGTVSGFGDDSKILASGVSGATTATLVGNDLNLKNGSGTILQTITLNTGSMHYDAATFGVTENIANNEATVTVSGAVTCFVAGTRIKTPMGEVPVDVLAAGDIVQTHFAGAAPVVWMGHRHVNCRRHPDPSKVWPVLVSAHAFGPRMPGRDLLLSPDHAVFVDGVLIPIKHLINGKTITQKKLDDVTYYHVELGEHDVLLADGLPAESYLENGDRCSFDNASGLVALHPDFGMRRWEAFGCAELVVAGARLAAVIARINARIPRSRRVARTYRRAA